MCVLNKLIKMRLTENLPFPLFCCTHTHVDNCYIILPKRKERLWNGAEGWTPRALPCVMWKLELEVWESLPFTQSQGIKLDCIKETVKSKYGDFRLPRRWDIPYSVFCRETILCFLWLLPITSCLFCKRHVPIEAITSAETHCDPSRQRHLWFAGTGKKRGVLEQRLI